MERDWTTEWENINGVKDWKLTDSEREWGHGQVGESLQIGEEKEENN